MSFKKFFAVAILATFAVCVSAQDFKKFRFGPTVGLNVATVTNLDASARVGFSVGALGEYNFTDHIFVTGALKFSQKGCKNDGFKANPGYIEIPIHGGYRYSFNEKFSVFGEFGPYFGIGVCGKVKYPDGSSVKIFGDDEDTWGAKRFDAGLGFAAGVEYCKFQMRLGYDFGLVKLFDVPDGAPKSKNRNFFVALSYMF